jgi:hypothetical protein
MEKEKSLIVNRNDTPSHGDATERVSFWNLADLRPDKNTVRTHDRLSH